MTTPTCDRCGQEPAVNADGVQMICDRCYDAAACCWSDSVEDRQ